MAPKNLAEIISECKNTAMKSPAISIPILDGHLIKWVGSVTSFAMGTIRATCCPYFSVSLFDETDSIQCIFTEMTSRLPEILQMLDKPILVTEPQFVIEIYVRDGNCKSALVHLFVEPDNVRLVGQDITDFAGGTGAAIGKRLSIIEIAKEANTTKQDAEFHQDIAVLKVSTAMLFNKEIYCFVLVTFIDSGEMKWLILKNNQVIWSNFLLPNRVYRIESRTDIENSITNDLLPRMVYKIGDLSLIQMLHHRDWLLSYNAVLMKECCTMRLMPGNAPTTNIPHQWLSVSENIQCDSKFTNLSGIVKKVSYRRGLKANGCLLCDKFENMPVNASFRTNASPLNTLAFDPFDPWRCVSNDRMPENGVPLPDLNEIKTMPTSFENLPFGVNKGKTDVEILLCDEKDGQNGVVYLKNWKAQHYPTGLVEGAVVCFTDVVRKISNKNNRYYINSPFTRVLLLKYNADFSERIFGTFGFRNAPFKRNDCEVWDALDMETLLRVDIAVRCRLCRQAMRATLCRNSSCLNYDTENSQLLENYASASVQMNGPPGAESVLITMKGEMVSTYLEIPDDIWQALFDVASFSPINYHHKMETYSVENDPLLSYLYLYCRGYRQCSRFHVSCRRVTKGQQGDDDFYECTSIRKITEDRLTASALLLDNDSV